MHVADPLLAAHRDADGLLRRDDFRRGLSGWPNASAGAAFVLRSSRLSLAERADADGKMNEGNQLIPVDDEAARQLCRATTSSACCVSS